MNIRIAAAAVLALLPTGAFAGPCSSGSFGGWLAPGFSCTVQDVTFSHFNLIPSSVGGATPVAASDIVVSPVDVVNDPGLRFGTSALFDTAGQTNDAVISFVTHAPTSHPISDVSLLISGSIIGDGSVTVGETIVLGIDPYTLTAYLPDHAFDRVDITPTSGAEIAKDAFVISRSGLSDLSFIQQQFSQGETPPPNVPEPASLVLLGVGLLGLGLTKRILA